MTRDSGSRSSLAMGAGLIVASATARIEAPGRSGCRTEVAGGTIVTELNSDVDYTDPQLTLLLPDRGRCSTQLRAS